MVIGTNLSEARISTDVISDVVDCSIDIKSESTYVVLKRKSGWVIHIIGATGDIKSEIDFISNQKLLSGVFIWNGKFVIVVWDQTKQGSMGFSVG